jgi:hypothetical protein
MFLGSMLRHIPAGAIKLQPVVPRQILDKLLVQIRLRPAQLVIEMYNRENKAEFTAQLKQQTQQRYRINPARYRDPYTVPRAQQFFTMDVSKKALG